MQVNVIEYFKFNATLRTTWVYYLVVTLSYAMALTGCSKDLSRGHATTLIESHQDFKSTFDAKVVVGRFWYDWRNVNDAFPFQPLAAGGILTLKETGKSYATWWKEYVADLTEEGHQQAQNWFKTSEKVKPSFLDFGPDSPEATVYHIPLASKKLLEVTGITADPSGKQAAIEFTWKWVPTPQSKLLPDKVPSAQVYKGRAIAQLYDDGWRIMQTDF